MLTITVLVENSDGKDLCGEHGLSLYIEYNGGKYLLDMGATELFAKNAARLGLSLADVEAAFLSHAHYDHAGGLSRFFAENPSICRKRLQKTATRRGREHGSTSACRGESCGSTPIGSVLCREHRRIRATPPGTTVLLEPASPPASGSCHTPLRIWKSRAGKPICAGWNTAAISQMTSPTSRA